MDRRLIATVCAFVITVGLSASSAPLAEAKTQLTPGTIQEVDSSTLKELLATFEQAEQAMQARDLEGIMGLYSEDYLYHGLKKTDIKKIWSQLFEHYKELESVHTFSVIRAVGSGSKLTVEMTCTGVVWGTSKDTTLRTPLDSWYEEIHYLKKENGRWRIVGNVGGESQPELQFGIA
ncbi:MAG TPA: nuclear transport factor 2 family protein, partial [Nitrospira sp.]|nr:nuclear transport factor 2 family protein [Nitrospira sp.]